MSIKVTDVNYTYMAGTPFQKQALKDVNIEINEGDFVGIIGHTGSGKSTFIQHLNGLLKLQTGTIEAFDITLTPKKRPKPDFRKLRGNIGIVFQYPEYQLFDETVAKDVAFGPKNMKLSPEEIDARVREAIELVGLDYELIKDRSPFELSGGQKRRVAIAGVIAMRPKMLILDEPTAGLDPMGRLEILELIRNLQRNCSPTIVMVSHNMDEISAISDKILVFDNGRIKFYLPPKELFTHANELYKIGLELPTAVRIRNWLGEHGVDIASDIFTKDELVAELIRYYKKEANNAK